MQDEQQDTAAITAQYEAPPAPGLKRFWMSVYTWLPSWPEGVPFHFWQTGSGSRYRLNPSMVGNPEAEGLPLAICDACETPDAWYDRFEADERLFERFYTCDGSVCMLVDAPDEAAAWALVKTYFTDGEDRFCNESDDTLTSLSVGGRFGHPDPRPAAA